MSDNSNKRQLELGIERSKEQDRNYHLGGRSFYFFDFDDNIAFLSTPLILFHKKNDSEIQISSADFAIHQSQIGKSGLFAEYSINWDDRVGTFRNFRDHDNTELRKLGKSRQIFIEDVALALGVEDLQWKGPSWECFYHASFNQRPVSVITARGHAPDTIKQGIRVFVDSQYLPIEPNYLSLFPVSNIGIRHQLGDVNLKFSTAELKQRAIRASVEKAIEVYGYSRHHRFGMSDDDPKNIQLIIEEMYRLKQDYEDMSFFMIETHHGQFIKHEITLKGVSPAFQGELAEQLNLFELQKLHKTRT